MVAINHLLTLQYVKSTEQGFEARLWNFQNDFTLERPTLAKLKDVIFWLTNEIEQANRSLSDYREQKIRIEELFAAAEAEQLRAATYQQSPAAIGGQRV